MVLEIFLIVTHRLAIYHVHTLMTVTYSYCVLVHSVNVMVSRPFIQLYHHMRCDVLKLHQTSPFLSTISGHVNLLGNINECEKVQSSSEAQVSAA